MSEAKKTHYFPQCLRPHQYLRTQNVDFIPGSVSLLLILVCCPLQLLFETVSVALSLGTWDSHPGRPWYFAAAMHLRARWPKYQRIPVASL